jgi:hypothetical protein
MTASLKHEACIQPKGVERGIDSKRGQSESIEAQNRMKVKAYSVKKVLVQPAYTKE